VLHVDGGGGSNYPTLSLSSQSTTTSDIAGQIAFGAVNTAAAEKRSAAIVSALTAGAGTNVTGDLRFFTDNAGTLGEKMRIQADGNVGIGTTSPARKLHISDAMRLQPIASPPASPSMGDLYADTSGELCYYDGAAWQGISSGNDANCS
jgi:hypothetical protein